MDPLIATLQQSSIGRQASRLQNARIIAEEFSAAGLPPSLALAAIVNANAESSLNALASGDNGKSIGLFQLHQNGGGKGMTVAERQDPRLNTRRIISEYQAARRQSSGYDLSQKKTVQMISLDDAYAQGATVATLAGLWGFHVERPFYLYASAAERAKMARSLFPGVADVAARQLDAGASVAGGAAQVGTGVVRLAGNAGLPRWATMGAGVFFTLTLLLAVKRLFRLRNLV
jgi:hypothetical protein